MALDPQTPAVKKYYASDATTIYGSSTDHAVFVDGKGTPDAPDYSSTVSQLTPAQRSDPGLPAVRKYYEEQQVVSVTAAPGAVKMSVVVFKLTQPAEAIPTAMKVRDLLRTNQPVEIHATEEIAAAIGLFLLNCDIPADKIAKQVKFIRREPVMPAGKPPLVTSSGIEMPQKMGRDTALELQAEIPKNGFAVTPPAPPAGMCVDAVVPTAIKNAAEMSSEDAIADETP